MAKFPKPNVERNKFHLEFVPYFLICLL